MARGATRTAFGRNGALSSLASQSSWIRADARRFRPLQHTAFV